MDGVLGDYDFSISYHPRIANVVADALSQKAGLAHYKEQGRQEAKKQGLC